MRWYITAKCVREFQDIIGINSFDDAAKRLDKLTQDARFTKDEGHRAIYRVNTPVNGRSLRLEFTVSLALRDEGDLPQLVRVRNKGWSKRRK